MLTQSKALNIFIDSALPLRKWSDSNGDRLRGLPWRDPGGGILPKEKLQSLSAEHLNVAELLKQLIDLDTDGPKYSAAWQSLEQGVTRNAVDASPPKEGFSKNATFGIAQSNNVAATFLVEQDCHEMKCTSTRAEIYALGIDALDKAYESHGMYLPELAWVEGLLSEDAHASGWVAPMRNQAVLGSQHFCRQLLRDVLIVLMSQRIEPQMQIINAFAIALETADSRRPGNMFTAEQTISATKSFFDAAKKL